MFYSTHKPSIKLLFLLLSLSTKAYGFTTEQITSKYGNFYYLGGVETLCKDYEKLILIESQRIKEKNNKSKSYYPTNDEISSVFRILALSEKIGTERLGHEIERCIK